MELPTGLLDAVRNYLNITWDDEAEEQKLLGIIQRGMRYLDSVAGAELDYEEEDSPRQLLFDFCFYARSYALEEYRANYLDELLALQIRQEVEYYEEGQKSI